MVLSALRKCFSRKSCAPIRKPAKRTLRMENLEDRSVPATFNVGAGYTYATIGEALTAAKHASGADTVVVHAGTYSEALVINDTAKVTLKASGNVVINAPANMDPLVLSGTPVGAAVIDIYSKNVTIDGFKVNGATNTDGDLFAGIRVVQDGSATIKNNTVMGMLNANDAAANIGIQVGTSRVSTVLGSGTAKVTDNIILDYKGAGILVDGDDASAKVKGNTITGRGLANQGIAQYGVQVSRGATARVESNTISGNDIDGAVEGGSNPATTSAGIFFFEGGKKSVAAKNNIFGNDDGILVQDSNGNSGGAIQIVNNDIYENNGYAGIAIISSNNVDVKNNDVYNNTSWNGIALDEVFYVDVTGNDITNNINADGIYVFGGGCNTIKCNETDSNGYSGILIEDSTNNLIWNNSSWSNALNGIYIYGGSGNDIWLGDSVNNVLDGILIEESSSNTVVGNFLVGNGGYGLRLVNADNTFVAFNLICSNDEGSIFIDSDSTGTVMIANRTDTPPEREGSNGASGYSLAYSTSFSDADVATSGLED